MRRLTGSSVLLAAAFLPALCTGCTTQGAVPDKAALRERNVARVAEWDRGNAQQLKDNKDALVLPGLVADRKARKVTVMAEMTGVGENDPAEFLLIYTASGHDYESLAVAFAKPSDVHKALEFIGLTPGHPVNPARLQTWPKGERAIITVNWDAPAEAGDKPKRFSVRSESLVLDKVTGAPLPPEGFVFVGSVRQPLPSDPAREVYAADEIGPNAIVAHYNEVGSVLDVPRIAPQAAVYNRQLPNPEYHFEKAQLAEFVFEPEHKDGKRRVADLRLRVGPRDGVAEPKTAGDLAFRLLDADGKTLNDQLKLEDAVDVFAKLSRDGRDPFVVVDIDAGLSLSAAREACRLLTVMDSEKGVRIEPPPAGQLYYRAFLPDESLRERAKRIVQPWECRMIERNGKVEARLTLIEDVRDATTGQWSTRERQFDASTPEAVRTALATKDKYGRPPTIPVVFIFAPSSMSYRSLLSLATHMQETHPTLFIFQE